MANRPNPSINTDASDKAAGAGYVKRWGLPATASSALGRRSRPRHLPGCANAQASMSQHQNTQAVFHRQAESKMQLRFHLPSAFAYRKKSIPFFTLSRRVAETDFRPQQGVPEGQSEAALRPAHELRR